MCLAKTVSKLNKRCLEAFNAGRYDEAFALSQQAIDAADWAGKVGYAAKLRANAAVLLASRGRMTEAHGHMSKAIERVTLTMGPESPLAGWLAERRQCLAAR